MKQFRFLDPDALIRGFDVAEDDEGFQQFLHNAESLSDSACLFFKGLYPIETPHFSWGEARHLPWSDQYYSLDASSQNFIPRSIASEVLRHASILRPAGVQADVEGDSNGFGKTYAIRAFTGDMLTMQGLAVEVMIAVDDAVWHLTKSRPIDAMNAISLAYQNIIECTVTAERILGSGRGAGQIGPEDHPLGDLSARFCIGPIQ